MSSPPTDRSRPAGGGNGELTRQKVDLTIAQPADNPRRDTLVRLIAELPPEQKAAAGLGWHLGHIDGRAEVYREIGRAGDDIMAGGLPLLRQPSYLELQRRRETIDHEPCRARCDRCSRCAHAASWARRGHRPYLGVQREAELAAGAR